MSSFDVILGMDWLSAYQAFIDCFQRRVAFLAPSGETCLFVGDRLSFPTSSLHLLHGRRGYDDYFANLLVDEGRVTHGEFPLIVCEFVNVFPEDLPSLPPICEIEFIIDLVPGMFPISILPY